MKRMRAAIIGHALVAETPSARADVVVDWIQTATPLQGKHVVKKILNLIALVGLYILATVPAASQVVVPTAAHQWEVHNSDGVRYGTDYELYDQKNKKQIGFEKKESGSGVDLGWVGDSGGHFNFRRKAPDGTRDHRTGHIPENADVAIYITKARLYLKYKRFGNTQAELELSSTPAYEWQVRDQKGTSVASFALFNSRVKKYLVLQTNANGTNLGWFDWGPRGQE